MTLKLQDDPMKTSDMLIENFGSRDAAVHVNRRFRNHGWSRFAGLLYVSSWICKQLDHSFRWMGRAALDAAILSSLALTLGCGGGSLGTPAGGGSSGSVPSDSVTIGKNVTGPFNVAMSTSFQPAEWDYTLFQTYPNLTGPLQNLQSQHIRLQGVSQGVPQGAANSTSTSWDFSILDAITQPVLSVGDHSPEFQIAKAPPFMYESDDSSNTFQDLTFQQCAGYAQNLVQYYSAGGLTANGQTYVSPAYPTDTVTWWGIYNEPNINNNLTAQQYVAMYNTLVPAMQAVDPKLKFAAVELADFQNQVQDWIPTFVSGVTAQVDALATHFYSTCDQTTDDATVFASVATSANGNFNFVTDVQLLYSLMAANPALANVPVWVTENNVNADYDAGNGMSACNPGQTFVTDDRGSSTFFAAWRPYVFSQLGKAGIRALYHWDFAADPQFGEVNVTTEQGQTQLSYWVDYWLQHTFPSPPGASLLQYSDTDDTEVETLPVMNSDGSVVVMVANHAVDAMTDNNGPGAPRSVLIDVSALGTFSSGSLLTIDANTSPITGPSQTSVTPAAQITISFTGYGVAFLTLNP